MALADPRIIYGVHSISPYSRTDGLPYGMLKVVGSANLALSSALVKLYGGSNKFAWAAENNVVEASLTAKVKAYPGFLFSLFLGADVTDTGADTSGTIVAATNVLGTSVVAATGITTVTVKAASKANLKFGKYVLKCTGAATLTLYLLSDIDIKRGTDGVYTDDTLLVTLSTITITTGGTTDIADFGLTITGGAGTIGMTTGDTATFEVLPPSTKSSAIVVGAASTTFPAFGAVLLSQKRATGEMFEIIAHNCVGGGLPINMDENAFSQPELKMECLYDSALDRVFTIRHILPS